MLRVCWSATRLGTQSVSVASSNCNRHGWLWLACPIPQVSPTALDMIVEYCEFHSAPGRSDKVRCKAVCLLMCWGSTCKKCRRQPGRPDQAHVPLPTRSAHLSSSCAHSDVHVSFLSFSLLFITTYTH